MTDELNERYPETFSAELIAHCVNGFVPPQVFHDIARSAVQQRQQRFVRLHPRFVSCIVRKEGLTADSVTERLRQLVAASFPVALEEVEWVSWLPCYVLAIARSVPLHTNALYQQGFLIGMDAASMAAVVALQPTLGDCCLDVCCAPAMKLSLIADAVTPCEGTSDRGGVAVGVDVNIDRLFVARSVVQRHSKAWEAQQALCAIALFAADGRLFSLEGAAKCLDQQKDTSPDAKGITTWEARVLKRARASAAGVKKASEKRPRDDVHMQPTTTRLSHEGSEACATTTHVVYASPCARALLRTKQSTTTSATITDEEPTLLFDRVLVDAECSHDGSLAHINVTEPPSSAAGRGQVNADEAGIKGGVDNTHRMARINLQSDPKYSAAHASTADLSFETTATWHISTWLRDIYLTQSPLAQLQLALLCRGYEVLKPGGTLVYSTCSFSFLQNEYILLCFLEHMRHAEGATSRATVCPAFDYAPSTSHPQAGTVQPFMCPAFPEKLQERLNLHYNEYQIVELGLKAVTVCEEDRVTALLKDAEKGLLGSRFWPLEFNTSFQYIVKIRKETV